MILTSYEARAAILPIGSVEFQSSHSKFEQQDPDEYQSSHRDPMQRTSIEPRSLMSTDVTSRDIQQGSGEVYGFKHIGNKTYRLSSELGTYLMSYFSFYYIWYLCCMKTEVHKVLYKFGYGVDVRSVCKTMRVPTLEIGNWENLGRVQCMRVFRTFLLCILFLFGVYPPPSFAEGGKIGMAVVLFSKQGKGCLATHHSIQSNSLQESNLTYKFIYEFGFDPGGPSPKSFMIPRDGGIFISPRQEEDPGSPSLMVLDTKRVSEVCRRDDIYISSEQAGKFKPKDYVEEIMTYISEEIVEEATKRVSEELCGNDIFDYSEPGAGLIDEVSGFSPAEQSFSSSGNNGTGGTTEGIVELYESFSLDSPCDTVGFDSESFVQFCFRFPVDGVCKLDSQIPLMPILTEGSHSMDPPENSKKRKTIEGGADSVVYLNDRNADLAGDDFFSQFPVQDSPAKSKHKGKVRLVFIEGLLPTATSFYLLRSNFVRASSAGTLVVTGRSDTNRKGGQPVFMRGHMILSSLVTVLADGLIRFRYYTGGRVLRPVWWKGAQASQGGEVDGHVRAAVREICGLLAIPAAFVHHSDRVTRVFNMLRPHEQGSEDDLLQSVEAAGGFLLEDEEGEWDYVDENGEEEEADYDPPRHWEVARDAGFVTSAAFVAPPALPQVRSGPELFDLTTPASRMILSSPLESGHGAKTPIVHQQNPVSAPGLHLPSGSVIGENYLHQPQTYDPRLLTSMGQQRQAAPLLNRSEINERVATLGIEGPRGTESIGEAPSAETFAAQIDSPRKAFGTTNAVGKQDYGLEDDGAMRGVYTGAREGDIHDLISKDSGVSALVSMASGGKLVLPNPTLDRLRRSSLGVEPSRFNLLLQHIGKFPFSA